MKQQIKLYKVKGNPNNPRIVKDDKFKKLVKSLKEFPEMLELRPIVVDENMIILGGNQRFRAAKEAGLKDVWIDIAKGFNEEQKKEFIIKDNVSSGEWEWDILANEWNVLELMDWGVKVPTIKNTELLSKLEYKSMYYEPEETPNIKLEDCINLKKYNEKVKALEDYDLTKEQKDVLKMFAYRFIKIDFESVANYYEFNASEEEKKAIERLRLVLVDNGISGFVEDDLLKILAFTEDDLKL
jgi:hypothetical protein